MYTQIMRLINNEAKTAAIAIVQGNDWIAIKSRHGEDPIAYANSIGDLEDLRRTYAANVKPEDVGEDDARSCTDWDFGGYNFNEDMAGYTVDLIMELDARG